MSNGISMLFSVIITIIYLMLYYIIKIKNVKTLIGFVTILHCFGLFFCGYPFFSTDVWDSDILGIILGYELSLLLFTFTIFRQDLRRRKIYEILNKNRMITLFVGPYSNLKQEWIDKISDELESLVAISDRYKSSHNIVLIGFEGKGKWKIKLTFIFWNEFDYNNFNTSNKNMIIDSCTNVRHGICVEASSIIAC